MKRHQPNLVHRPEPPGRPPASSPRQGDGHSAAPRDGASGEALVRLPRALRSGPALLLALQSTVGNQAVQRWLGLASVRAARPSPPDRRTAMGASPPGRQAGPVVQRSLGLHIVAELPAILMKLFLHGEGKEGRAFWAAQRRWGDEARRWTLATFVANRIAAFAEREGADSVRYSPDQAARIQQLLERLDRLGHAIDDPQFGWATIRLDGGFFARAVADAPPEPSPGDGQGPVTRERSRPLYGPSSGRDYAIPSWPAKEGELRALLELVEIEVEAGQALKMHGPGAGAQGPVAVDRELVERMFLTQSFADYEIPVRGEPVSRPGDDEA